MCFATPVICNMTTTIRQRHDFRCGSKGEILARSTCFPLYPRKRTHVGHRAMSVSCQYRKWQGSLRGGATGSFGEPRLAQRRLKGVAQRRRECWETVLGNGEARSGGNQALGCFLKNL